MANNKKLTEEQEKEIKILLANNEMLDRDQKERGRSVDSIINQYFATVQPMYEEIIEPSSYYADMLINNDGYDNKSIEVLAAVLRALVNGEME